MPVPVIQKFSLKFPIKNSQDVRPESFFKIFNAWIPSRPEIFIDVADYSHVTDGPLTVLIGHYADLVLDKTENTVGFVYRQKRTTETSFEKILAKSLKQLLHYAKLIDDDASITPRVLIDKTQLEISFNDRLLAPNTAEAFKVLDPVLTKSLAGVFGGTKFTITPAAFNSQTRLTVKVVLK